MHFKKLYKTYLKKYRKSSPHVQTVYGPDISLMTEIVIDTEMRNLFPDLHETGAGKGDLHITPQSSLKIFK